VVSKAEDTRGRKPAPSFDSDFRSRKSAPVFDPVCLQPKTRRMTEFLIPQQSQPHALSLVSESEGQEVAISVGEKNTSDDEDETVVISNQSILQDEWNSMYLPNVFCTLMSENLCEGAPSPHIFTEQGPIGFKSGPVTLSCFCVYLLMYR